jgi:hypothetical protein
MVRFSGLAVAGALLVLELLSIIHLHHWLPGMI